MKKILLEWFGRGSGNSVTLYYFPILGQSQAGGFNATPALTTSGDSQVVTLTNGPIDVSTSGSLITSVEGDTFFDRPVPQNSTNVETIATSFGRQLKAFVGATNNRFAVSVHAESLTTIQNLSKGAPLGRFEEIIACTSRLKTLANANGWAFETHLIFFHGGTGDNGPPTYKASLLQLYTDWANDISPYTSQANKYLFTHQQRPIGTPDYGQQQYEAMASNSNILVVGPEYKATYQGDGVHLTNHGERYMAMIWARAVYKKLFGSGFRPLELDIANATLNAAGTVITVPVLNAVGALQKTTNAGIQIYSSTTSTVFGSTVAINGTSLDITLTDNQRPVGSHNILIRTGVAANGELCDSSSSVDIPSFNDAGASPYNLNKYMVRAEFAKTFTFPVNLIVSFGGDGNSLSAPPPGITTQNGNPVFEIWTAGNGNVQEKTTANILLQGNVSFDILATSSNYLGFTATTQKAGRNTLTGTNIYANEILQDYYFVENKFCDFQFKGLDPTKTYTFKFSSLRTGTATNRETIISVTDNVGTTSVTKTSNRSGTASVFTTQAEQAVFSNVVPTAGGTVNFRLNQNSTQFGYLNALEITQN